MPVSPGAICRVSDYKDGMEPWNLSLSPGRPPLPDFMWLIPGWERGARLLGLC